VIQLAPQMRFLLAVQPLDELQLLIWNGDPSSARVVQDVATHRDHARMKHRDKTAARRLRSIAICTTLPAWTLACAIAVHRSPTTT
jgi:hypothetical protein